MTDLILPLEEPSAEQIIADFPSWDLPGDLSNWFLLMDAIAEANTPRLRVTAAIIRSHLLQAKAHLHVLQQQKATMMIN